MTNKQWPNSECKHRYLKEEDAERVFFIQCVYISSNLNAAKKGGVMLAHSGFGCKITICHETYAIIAN